MIINILPPESFRPDQSTRRAGWKIKLAVLFNVLFLAALCGHTSDALAQTRRMEDSVILQQGKQLFQNHCAECHGQNAQGLAEDWRVRDENGRYPPPPLNGSAHTWHHPLPVLVDMIENGTLQRGGSMPPWKDTLSRNQVLTIIVWLSSLWPDEIYQIWYEKSFANPS